MSQYKFLLIDDSRSVHAFLRQILEPMAKEIHDCMDGLQGVEHLKNNQNYDLIFLDWEMPVMDGPTAFDEMKKMKLKVPVVMLTSKNDPMEIMKMIEAGVVEYLLKPFTADIIESKVKSILEL
jgi:CheY-like chemotaxis protein